jgi:bacterioferritin-associated ferredoxin
MYVCLCNGVTDKDLCEAISAGASTLEEIAYCTGAGTRCGSCVPAIHAALVEAETGAAAVQRAEEPRRSRLRVLTSAA